MNTFARLHYRNVMMIHSIGLAIWSVFYSVMVVLGYLFKILYRLCIPIVFVGVFFIMYSSGVRFGNIDVVLKYLGASVVGSALMFVVMWVLFRKVILGLLELATTGRYAAKYQVSEDARMSRSPSQSEISKMIDSFKASGLYHDPMLPLVKDKSQTAKVDIYSIGDDDVFDEYLEEKAELQKAREEESSRFEDVELDELFDGKTLDVEQSKIKMKDDDRKKIVFAKR